MKDFIRQLTKRGGRVLDTIKTANGNDMIFYRETDTLVSDIRTKVFYN